MIRMSCALKVLTCGGPVMLCVLAILALPTGKAQEPGKGKAVFQSHCSVCHGPDATGNGPAASGLDPQPANLRSPQTQQKTSAQLRGIVQNGIKGTAMTAWKGVLSDQQIDHVVAYIKSLSPRSRARSGACTNAWCAT